MLHDEDDVALVAFALRVEGHEDDQERLHAQGDRAAVEAHLRPTLSAVVLGVDLQGVHPRPIEEDRKHRREVDRVPGEGEGAIKCRACGSWRRG